MKVLVTGGSGMLGKALVRRLSGEFNVTYTVHRTPAGDLGARVLTCDLADEELKLPAFDAVIHTTALTDVDHCQSHPEEAFRANVLAARNLVRACSQAYFVYLSTDFVFDGAKGDYTERDAVNPLSVYGQTKHQGEQEIPSTGCVLRTSIYGLEGNGGRPTFIEKTLDRLRQGGPVFGFDDQWFTPMSIYNLAELTVKILRKKPAGVLHLGGPEKISKYDFLRKLAVISGYPDTQVKANSAAGYEFAAPRPRDASLNIGRARDLLDGGFWTVEQSLRDIRMKTTGSVA